MPPPTTNMPQPQASVSSYLEYEYYTPAGDLENEIRNALLDLADSNTNALFDINKSVWILETGINYLVSDSAWNFEDFEEQIESFELDLTDQSLIYKGDLRQVIVDLHDIISQNINSEKKFVATDVKVSDIAEDKISIDCYITFLIGVTSAPQPPYHCTLGTTSTDRVAGYAYICPYQPGNLGQSAWTTIRKNAQQCLRDYWGFSPYSLDPRFYTNVLQYSSIISPGVPNIYVSPNHLLGHSAAPFSAHQQKVPRANCVLSSQQNRYTEVVYDDVDVLLGATKGVINLSLQNSPGWENGIEVCEWDYKKITTGTVGFPQLSQLTIQDI